MKGFSSRVKRRMKSIAKEKIIGEKIKESLRNGDWKTVLDEFAGHVSNRQMLILWEILFEADLEDYQQLEEKIYAYGSCLATKDVLGRLLFTRMVTVLRKAQIAEQQ